MGDHLLEPKNIGRCDLFYEPVQQVEMVVVAEVGVDIDFDVGSHRFSYRMNDLDVTPHSGFGKHPSAASSKLQLQRPPAIGNCLRCLVSNLLSAFRRVEKILEIECGVVGGNRIVLLAAKQVDSRDASHLADQIERKNRQPAVVSVPAIHSGTCTSDYTIVDP